MEIKTEYLVRRKLMTIENWGSLPRHQYNFGFGRVKAVTPDFFHTINSIEKEKGYTAIVRVNLRFLSTILEACKIGDEGIKNIFLLDFPNQLELNLSMIYAIYS